MIRLMHMHQNVPVLLLHEGLASGLKGRGQEGYIFSQKGLGQYMCQEGVEEKSMLCIWGTFLCVCVWGGGIDNL